MGTATDSRGRAAGATLGARRCEPSSRSPTLIRPLSPCHRAAGRCR